MDTLLNYSRQDDLPEKEIYISALMSLRDMLGWGEKTMLFSGKTVADFLKMVSTKNGETLYDLLVGDDGAVGLQYMVRLNNRSLRHTQSLETVLCSGDQIVLMPVITFAAGG